MVTTKNRWRAFSCPAVFARLIGIAYHQCKVLLYIDFFAKFHHVKCYSTGSYMRMIWPIVRYMRWFYRWKDSYMIWQRSHTDTIYMASDENERGTKKMFQSVLKLDIVFHGALFLYRFWKVLVYSVEWIQPIFDIFRESAGIGLQTDREKNISFSRSCSHSWRMPQSVLPLP